MADIVPLDRGIFQDTGLVSLGQSVTALCESFNQDREFFVQLLVVDADKNIWAEDALDAAATKLRNLASDIRRAPFRSRHRGDAA